MDVIRDDMRYLSAINRSGNMPSMTQYSFCSRGKRTTEKHGTIAATFIRVLPCISVAMQSLPYHHRSRL
jgi:hypothetical protein